MVWIISIVLLLAGCSPDMDEIVAEASDSDVLLPAKPRLKQSTECKECAINKCSKQRRECEKDKGCIELLGCKSKKNSLSDLIACDKKISASNDAQRKYKNYFSCVYLDFTTYGCQNKCKAGLTSVDNWDCESDTPANGEVDVTIRIHQIQNMWPISKMTSPGEHNVRVRWVDDRNNDDPLRRGYTNGLGEVVITVPKNVQNGYFEIMRASTEEVDQGNIKGDTFEDLGPFLYYLGRSIETEQTITVFLPSKSIENIWASDYAKKRNYNGGKWDFRNGSIITVIAYDCLGVPVPNVILDFDPEGDSNPSSVLGYWNTRDDTPSNLIASYLFFNAGDDEKTSSLGIGSFLYSPDYDEGTAKITASIAKFGSSLPVKYKSNYTTFVNMYLGTSHRITE